MNIKPFLVERSGRDHWRIVWRVCREKELRGMTLPFTVCSVGLNGSVIVMRLIDLNSPTEELSKTSGRIVELPINIS